MCFAAVPLAGTCTFARLPTALGIGLVLSCAGLGAFLDRRRSPTIATESMLAATLAAGATTGAAWCLFASGAAPAYFRLIGGAFGGGMLALCLFGPLALIALAKERLGWARAGSIVDRADRRRIVTVTACMVALLTDRSWAARPSLGGMAALVIAAAATLDAIAWRRLRRLRRGTDRWSQSASPPPHGNRLDLGVGDAWRIQLAAGADPFRSSPLVVRALWGDFALAEGALRACLWVDALALLCAGLAQLGWFARALGWFFRVSF
jgi:hypothetical protein